MHETHVLARTNPHWVCSTDSPNWSPQQSRRLFFLGALFRSLDVTLGRSADEYSHALAWPQRADVVHFTAGQALAFSCVGEIYRLNSRQKPLVQ
jgi:hypothetical protein